MIISDMDMIAQDMVCIAERADGKGKVEGYYFCLHHNDGRKHLHHLIIPLEADLSRGTPLDQIQVEVVPESITLKALEPQPPKHIHEEYPEHDWERKKDRSIDEFAMESDFHNGPRCKRCYDTFCVHCVPDGYETHKPCIIDEDRCPKCGNKLFPPFGKARKITYCANCGQAVKWE